MAQHTPFGISADNIQYFRGLQHVSMPLPRRDKVATLNRQGFMRIALDPFSLSWINDACAGSLPFLEVGAAYGEATVQAITKGATVIANDICLEHLEIIRRRTGSRLRKKLFLNHSSFPEQLHLPDLSLGGVLFCRVGHFFTIEQIEQSFRQIYRWLAPGGKLYFVATAPYHHMFSKSFVDAFHYKCDVGDMRAGYVANLRTVLPQSAEYIPEFMHVFNHVTASKFITEANFQIQRCELFDYDTQNSQGQGFVGVEAVKQ